MAQQVDVSVPRGMRVAIVLFLLTGGFTFVVASFVGPVIEKAGIVDNGFVAVTAAGIAVYLAACAVWVRRRQDTDDSSVWGGIPSSQYSGRHAESGGIARQEQEKALQELQERGETIQELQDHNE